MVLRHLQARSASVLTGLLAFTFGAFLMVAAAPSPPPPPPTPIPVKDQLV